MPADLVFGSRNFRREMMRVQRPGRHLRPRRRRRSDPRRRRPLPRARGQPAHPVGRELHAREPRGAEAHLRGPVRPLRRARDRPVPARAVRDAPVGRAAIVRQRAEHRPAHPGCVQLGVLRALVPGPADGHRDRRGARSGRPPQPRLQPHDEGHAARRRHLPAHRRRLPRPARLPAGQPARRARPAQRVPGRQRDARQRDRHRRRRRQGDLPVRAGDDPLLPRRGGHPRQRADVPRDRSRRPRVRARPPRGAGRQGGRPVGRLRDADRPRLDRRGARGVPRA